MMSPISSQCQSSRPPSVIANTATTELLESVLAFADCLTKKLLQLQETEEPPRRFTANDFYLRDRREFPDEWITPPPFTPTPSSTELPTPITPESEYKLYTELKESNTKDVEAGLPQHCSSKSIVSVASVEGGRQQCTL